MAQFRTSADILDEILQKAGEPTNGNSPYETLALTYANKVHHAIIGGGNIFNITVDEPWIWARSKHPIILELKPAYTSGAISCTNSDVNITFTIPPTDSLEGWHIQVNGLTTVYKIMQHTAGEAAAVLDSSFVDTTGAYAFRCFKLDYEIRPAYVYIDDFTDRVDFQETASATLSTTLTHGAYTLSGLISHVAARIDATGANTYAGTFDSVLKRYTISRTSTAAGTTFNLLGVSGTNRRRSVLPLLGFDRLDYTGSQTYTSSYTPNSISRLIEPFKLFNGEMGMPFIYSTDTIKMQEDYPISHVRERVPDRFARITEEPDGTVWVRFNAYPKYQTKVQIDWIPTPEDLQDNVASQPKLPRSEMDALIHGAAAFIAFDKEDNKWQAFVELTKAQLEAMKTKNRSQLLRTGETFGAIVPRADLDYNERRFQYGYTSGSTGTGSTASTTDVLVSVTIPYTSFSSAGTQTSVLARTLPSTRSIFSIIAKHSTSFQGGATTAAQVDVGINSDPTYFISAFDVRQTVSGTAQASYVGLYYPAAETGIYVRLTSAGGNLSELTQGSLILYFQESIVP